MDDQRGMITVLTKPGMLPHGRATRTAALARYTDVWHSRAPGARDQMALCLNNLGVEARRRGDVAQALAMLPARSPGLVLGARQSESVRDGPGIAGGKLLGAAGQREPGGAASWDGGSATRDDWGATGAWGRGGGGGSSAGSARRRGVGVVFGAGRTLSLEQAASPQALALA